MTLYGFQNVFLSIQEPKCWGILLGIPYNKFTLKNHENSLSTISTSRSVITKNPVASSRNSSPDKPTEALEAR
jgi:hypothetical protein